MTLGILGGMGPLASAEFLQTIYELNPAPAEQHQPACVLYSDPSIPDRTEAIARGDDDLIVAALSAALERLTALGVDAVVIACVTAHHFLPRLPARLRARVLSLIDVTFMELAERAEPHLLICTTGTRAARIFERHERWPVLGRWFIHPGDDDQRRIHQAIYRIKQDGVVGPAADFFEELRGRYGAAGLLAACTELHLVIRHARRHGRGEHWMIDPLWCVARDYRRWFTGDGEIAPVTWRDSAA